MKLKNNQSKLKYIRYPKFIIQLYLRNSLFNKEEAIFLANARSRMLNVRHNRKNLHTDLKCPLGCYHDDKQEELLNCYPLITQLTCPLSPLVKYEDIFSPDIRKQHSITIVLKDLMEVRDRTLMSLN